MKKALLVPILAILFVGTEVKAESLQDFTPPTKIAPPVEAPKLPEAGSDEKAEAAEADKKEAAEAKEKAEKDAAEAAAKAEQEAAELKAKEEAEAAEADKKEAAEAAVKAEQEAAELKAKEEMEAAEATALTDVKPLLETNTEQNFEMYYVEGCEDCEAQKAWLDGFKEMYPNASIEEIEILNNEENKAGMLSRLEGLGVEQTTGDLPLNILNGEVVEGFKPEKIMSLAQQTFGKPSEDGKKELTADEQAQKDKNRKIRTFLLVSALAFMIFIWGFSGANRKEQSDK